MIRRKFLQSILIVVFIISGAVTVNSSIRCGDIDGNDDINILDVSCLVSYMYKGGEVPQDLAGCDVNLSGAINILDISYLIRYIYLGGPPPCPEQAIPEGQKYIFEIEYINYAWGYRLEGLVIDSGGNIFSYNYDHTDTPWEPAQPGILTQADLDAKFGHNQVFVGSIPRDTLLRYFQLVKPAAQGPYSPSVYACNDFGSGTVRAYQYEAVSGDYQSVMMYIMGDFAMKNLSPHAAIIFRWMWEDIFGESIDNIICGYQE